MLLLGGALTGLGGTTAAAGAEKCDAGSTTAVPASSEPADPHIVPLGGPASELDLDEGFVYALHDLTVPMESPSGFGRYYRTNSRAVSRVDRRTREVVRGDTICFGFEMSLAGRSLWVLDLELKPESCHGILYRFDRRTLRRTATIDLPPPPPLKSSSPARYSPASQHGTPCDATAMTSAPGGRLWVAVGRHLHRVAGDDGRIEATIVTETPASDLEVDPAGRHLYSAEGRRVVRRHARHGVAQVASRVGVDSPDTLAATSAGVWVAVRDEAGGERRLVHLDRRRLRETARVDRRVGYALAMGKRSLWAVLDEDLHCLDATTGRPRAPVPQGRRAAMAADGAGVYLNGYDGASPDRSGVYFAEPDAGCRW